MKASSSTGNIHPWHSPIPYLFGGLALMSVLIAAALVILACSYRKRPASQAQEKSVHRPVILPLDPEPRIVVIMAGDELPRFLAKPAAAHPPVAKTIPPDFPCSCDDRV